MKRDYISIKIEGDFIDSFIYAGTLFLVDAKAQISTYHWEDLLSSISPNKQNSVFRFLKDCRESLSAVDFPAQKIYEIDEKQLEATRTGKVLQLKGWSTDINVYANRLYIADENGVEEIGLDWKSNQLLKNTSFQVWNQYAYKVSPNDYHRLGIAAGSNGIITAFLRGGRNQSYLKKEEDIKIIEIDTCDCEWIGNNLVSNSDNGTFISIFEPLPEKPKRDLPKNFWKEFDKLKKQTPDTVEIPTDKGHNVIYAWMAGDKLFSLLNDGKITQQPLDLLTELKGNHTTWQTEIQLSKKAHVLAARSALFGAVIEIGDDLLALSENGYETIAKRPVNWRVFPRAKSYLNHLHIIEEDCLAIRAYFVNGNDDADKYGMSLNEIPNAVA